MFKYFKIFKQRITVIFVKRKGCINIYFAKLILRLVSELNCHAKKPYEINEENKEEYTEIRIFCGI